MYDLPLRRETSTSFPRPDRFRDEQFDEITLFVDNLALNGSLIEESVEQHRCRHPEHDTQDGRTVEGV